MFPDLFDGTLGEFKGVKADFKIIPGHEKYLKVFPVAKVPHGITKEYDKELDKMMETCVPVDGRGLKVATQVVPVVKKVGDKIKLRLVGNFKRTINDHIEDEPYQFVSINDQFTKLSGEYFRCLDFTGAYKQVVVGEGGDFLTLNTHKELKRPGVPP